MQSSYALLRLTIAYALIQSVLPNALFLIFASWWRRSLPHVAAKKVERAFEVDSEQYARVIPEARIDHSRGVDSSITVSINSSPDPISHLQLLPKVL